MASTPAKVTTTKTTTTKTPGKTVTSTTTTSAPAQKANTAKKATTAKKAAPAKKTTATAKKTKAPAKLAGTPLAAHWLTGIGDERQVCAPVAVANSLLAVLGVHAGNGDVERLYRAAGGWRDSGVPVEAVLEAAAREGIAGCRLAAWRPLAQPGRGGLLLLSLDITPDLHAVAYLGGGTVATWGDAVPLTDLSAEIEGAWSLTWHR